MAKFWYGTAAISTDSKTLTVTGSMVVGSPVGITIGQTTVQYVVQSGDTTAVAAAALYSLISGSSGPEFQEITWAYVAGSSVITGTAQQAGSPFSMTAVGPTGAVTFATLTAATGPSDVANANNWSGGTLPVNGDDVIVQGNAASMLYNMSALSGISLNSFTVYASFQNSIGLPSYHGVISGTGFPASTASGVSNAYPEYRARYLVLGGNPTVNLGTGVGQGSPRINLQVGTGTCTVNVFGAASPADSDLWAVRLINSGGSTNKLNVTGGRVGVATELGMTATLNEIRVGDKGNPGTDATVGWGAGATITNVLNLSGKTEGGAGLSGTLTMGLNAGQHTQTAGNLTANVYGGTLYYSTSGTLTATNVQNGASVDLSRDPRTKTINGTFTGGSSLIDPGATYTSGTTAFDEKSFRASRFGPTVSIVR